MVEPYDCKYHVVFIPKRRKKRIFGVLLRELEEMFHDLAGHKESKIVEGRLMGEQRNFTGENCWTRGYFVSTVGLDGTW